MSAALRWATAPAPIKCTSAVSAMFPDIFFHTNWNASVAAQMLAPPPVTRYSRAPSNSTLPFWGVTPTSAFDSNSPRLWAPHVAARQQTARKLNDPLAFINVSKNNTCRRRLSLTPRFLLGRPVCRVTYVSLIFQVRQNGAAQGDYVHRALFLIDHSSTRGDHHGVR